MSKPTLCLDFDGVIHSYTSGWKGPATIPDPPVPGAFQFIEAALESFEVAIFSSRSGQEESFDSGLRIRYGTVAMREWFAKWAEKELGLVRGRGVCALVSWPERKPSAFITIDDRAITFTGQWPLIADLHAFKPWNKQEPQSNVGTSEARTIHERELARQAEAVRTGNPGT